MLKARENNRSVKDFSAFCHPGTGSSEQWFTVSGQVSLRVITFTPAVQTVNHPIVFISGLASVIEGFREALIELTRDFKVYYVDTREKVTSRITGKVSFAVEAFSGDISTLVRILGLEDGKYHMFGYSLGATVIIDCYRDLVSRPHSIFLLEPNATFDYPRIALAIMRLNLPLLYIAKPLVKWYILRFRINRKEDYHMYLISARSLDSAHPIRLRKTALGISNYKIWDKLPFLACPTLIIGTSKDHFHSHEDVKKMITGIQNCTYIDLENNRRTHSTELGVVIRNYIGALKSDGSWRIPGEN